MSLRSEMILDAKLVMRDGLAMINPAAADLLAPWNASDQMSENS